MRVAGSTSRTAADVLGPLLRSALGRELPFRLRFWDGSVTGAGQSPLTLVVAQASCVAQAALGS